MNKEWLEIPSVLKYLKKYLYNLSKCYIDPLSLIIK
jgi:hypothetical protein